MEGGGGSERKLSEREREENLFDLSSMVGDKPRLPLFMLPLQRERQEALARAAMLVHTLRACMHLIVCA